MIKPPCLSAYLEKWIEQRTRVSIYLISGICLRGYVVANDSSTLLLKSALATGRHQLIHMHSIASMEEAVTEPLILRRKELRGVSATYLESKLKSEDIVSK